MRRLAPLVAAVALLLAAGAPPLAACGGEELVTERIGDGPAAVTIVRPEGLDTDVPLVLFLHGWGATDPRAYRPWIEHLARAGNAVIYPRYQDSFAEPPAQVLGNVVLGVRAALARLDEDPGSLVAAGHSAGGALAADYAAVARSVGLPSPRAVFAAYPGRRFAGRGRRRRPRRRPGRGARDRRARAPGRRRCGRRPRPPRAAAGRSRVPARVLGPARRVRLPHVRRALAARGVDQRVEAAAEEHLLRACDEGRDPVLERHDDPAGVVHRVPGAGLRAHVDRAAHGAVPVP